MPFPARPTMLRWLPGILTFLAAFVAVAVWQGSVPGATWKTTGEPPGLPAGGDSTGETGSPIVFDGGRVPVLREAVLADGVIAATAGDRLTFYDLWGRRLAETVIQRRVNEPVVLHGFSPDGRFFYTQAAAVSGMADAPPTLTKLRMIDFRQGTDEVVLTAPNYHADELIFHPDGGRMLVNFTSGEGSLPKLWTGKGKGKGFMEVRPVHPVVEAAGGFNSFSFNPEGTRVYFNTSVYGRKVGPPIREGDEVFAMAPDGRDVRMITLGMPGFMCGQPLHSPAEPKLAVTCWRLGERPATANVYLVTLGEREEVLYVKRLTNLDEGGKVYPALWSGDGRFLVANNRAGCDDDIHFFDIATGAAKHFIAPAGTKYGSRPYWVPGERTAVYVLRKPDCNVATGSAPGRLIKLNLATSREKVVLDGVKAFWVSPPPAWDRPPSPLLAPRSDNSIEPIPKVALGRGSVALVKEGGSILEILDPSGRMAARIVRDDPGRRFGSSILYWSPAGDVLLQMLPGDAGSSGLRVLDFSAGEDRLLLTSDPAMAVIRGGSSWLGQERVLVSSESFLGPYMSLPPGLWTVGMKGEGLALITVRSARPGPVSLAGFDDLWINDVTPDGGSALFRFEWGNPDGGAFMRGAVVIVNLGTGEMKGVSPEGEDNCWGGFFSTGPRRIFFICDTGEASEKTVKVYRAREDGSGIEEVMRLRYYPRGYVGLVAVSPDGAALVLAGHVERESFKILLFDVATGEIRPLLTLKAFGEGEVRPVPVGFTPDGRGFLVLRIPEEEVEAGFGGGVLERIDIATGEMAVVAREVHQAVLAE